jgi:para-aminobenzoate synthetase component 1
VKKATTFTINNFTELRIKMLNWLKPFNIFCLLDNSGYHFEEPAFECLLAVGCKARLELNAGNAFTALKEFSVAQNDWLFGHLAYDLKNETEQLQSGNFDGIGFKDVHFFVPEIVLQLSENALTIFCDGDASEIFDAVQSASSAIEEKVFSSPVIKSRFTPTEYVNTVKKLQQHILRGDCYEINFCQEFYSTDAVIDPVTVYQKLANLSPNPFAALYKSEDKFCICASPERYLKKRGTQVFSQPIKGTAKRYLGNQQKDETSKQELVNSEKEKSENVMVVDLVRNDLSKVCKKGTVQVEELFGLYSFPQVHQMISTISGELQDDIDWVDVVKATFPMGSMTGAPKMRVMQLIEDYEQTKRGLFSGAIGYIDPQGDFDFNVVIRSIMYNATTKYLSFQTGSAITFYSDAEKEYEECLLKAAVIKQVLA